MKIYETKMKFILYITLICFSQGALSQGSDFIELRRDSVTVFVKDTTAYSQAYIDELLNCNLSTEYILNDDSLIVSRGVEYGLFYTGLEKDSTYEFLGKNGGYEVLLTVKRINYSTITYSAVIKSGELGERIQGIAHGGVAILGSESDDDDQTGDAYLSAEYSSNWITPNHSIRIDKEKNNRAKIIVTGNSGITLNLSDCPTLRLVTKTGKKK